MLGAMSIAAVASGTRTWTAARFTILSNIAVCVVCAMLAARPDRDGPVFRVARLDAVVSIIVTGLGWLVFGPRPRIPPRVIWLSGIAPIVWLAYTLARGELAEWYPYPFVDVNDHGYGRVLLNCVGVAVLFLVCGFVAMLAERRLSATPRPVEG